MYRKDATSYFIVDAHVALRDARPEYQRNIHGMQFIDCFHDYHRNRRIRSSLESRPRARSRYACGCRGRSARRTSPT